MSNLKNIREKFGISQQQIADWLGISRSLAQYYEQGQRSLPTHALLKLAKLEIMIMEFEKSQGVMSYELQVQGCTSPELQTQDNTLQSGLTTVNKQTSPEHPRLALQSDKTERMHQQLAFIKNRHAVLQQQLLLIKNLIDNCDEQTGEKEKLWLQMLYHGVVCKLSKFDETKQLPLKAKILEMRVKEEMRDKKVG